MKRVKKIDKSRFNFLNAEGSILDKMLQKVNHYLQDIVESRPYKLDWEHVLSEYDKLGQNDIAEFACSYSFGWHAMNQQLDNDISKQTMYEDIIQGIIKRRENVK